jgi:SAM-dependent methyltransferase
MAEQENWQLDGSAAALFERYLVPAMTAMWAADLADRAALRRRAFPDATFDVVLCQLGLQFFPDRAKALREMRRVLAPDGRVALSVFGPIEHNPATRALADALDRHVRPGASTAKRTEHALADTAELRALVTSAGFSDVAIRTATKQVRFPSGAEYVRIQLAATPLAAVIADCDAARRERLVEAVTQDVCAALDPYLADDGLAFPQEVHTALARAF